MNPKAIHDEVLRQKTIDGYVEKYGWEFLHEAGNQLVFQNGKKEMIAEISEDGTITVFEDGKLRPNMYQL